MSSWIKLTSPAFGQPINTVLRVDDSQQAAQLANGGWAIAVADPGGTPPTLAPASPAGPLTTDVELAAAATALGSPGPALAFAGVLATLRRGYRSTCVALIGDSTGDGYLGGQVSSPVDEWPQVLLKKLAADYPAYTLIERRWNDGAQGYDPATVLQNGTGNGGGTRRATFNKLTPGSLAYTGTAVTGDMDIRARIAPVGWVSSSSGTIAAKWEGTTAQRSWLLLLNTDGTLAFQWTTDGVTSIGPKTSTVPVSGVAGVANGQPYWVRAVMDVDNGSAGNTLVFYTSPDGLTWTQLGSPVTTAGITSIFAGTAPYQVGAFGIGLSNPFNGEVYEVAVRPGLTTRRSVVAPLPDDWEWYSGQATVSFAGAPVLTLLNGSQSGQNVAYFDDPTRRVIVHQPFGQAVVMVSTAHNDGTQYRQTWLANYAALLTNVKGLVPNVPILCLGQNPTAIGALVTAQQGVELRAGRSAILQQLAAAQAGVYSFDAWPLLTPADTIDGLHPTYGAGSGSEKWGLGLYTRIKTGT